MATRLSTARWRSATGSQAHHRDTPPEDVRRVEAGLLARGSSLPSAFPGSSQWPKLTSAHRSQLRGQRRPCPDRTIGPHRFPSWLRGEWSRRPRPVNYGRGPTGRQDKYKDIFISLYYLKSQLLSLKHEGDPVPPHRRDAHTCLWPQARAACCAFQNESGNGSACDHARPREMK